MDLDLHTLSSCCRALAATPLRLARPRRPDRRLLASLADGDAGVPPARRAVTLTALYQTQRTAPTAVVAEGLVWPWRLTLGMTTFLVVHPQARFLVDPALCADAHRRVIPELPTALRAVVAPDKPVTGLPEALGSAGLTPADIDFALPTHLHWDHVAGLAELPAELPVQAQEVERAFALGTGGPFRTPLGVARGPLRAARFAEIALDGPPVLTFPAGHDLFGDGSVVVVPLPGHTPGSVGVLLHLAGGRRVLLAGDAAWHGLQISRLREKAPFPGDLVDADRDTAFATLHRLHALPSRITVLPSHDRAAAAEFAVQR